MAVDYLQPPGCFGNARRGRNRFRERLHTRDMSAIVAHSSNRHGLGMSKIPARPPPQIALSENVSLDYGWHSGAVNWACRPLPRRFRPASWLTRQHIVEGGLGTDWNGRDKIDTADE